MFYTYIKFDFAETISNSDINIGGKNLFQY